MTEAATDRQLIQRIAKGDRAAMRVFYERYHDAAYRFIRSRGGDEFEAADVLQDAMMEVWRAADRFQGASSARTWLFSIARNKMIDRIRKGSRIDHFDEAPEQVDDAPGPHAVLETVDDHALLKSCVEKLSEAHRRVIHLAFFEDMTYPDISEIERVAVGTIKTRIFHAKKLLMSCLSAALA